MQAVIERTELRITVAVEREANRTKDHFLAMLSHELRTPLTPALMIAKSMITDEKVSWGFVTHHSKRCKNLLWYLLFSYLFVLARMLKLSAETYSWKRFSLISFWNGLAFNNSNSSSRRSRRLFQLILLTVRSCHSLFAVAKNMSPNS